MAPPGIEVEYHIKPLQISSWGFHSQSGWYVGPSLEHHNCYKILDKTTKHIHITDTLRFNTNIYSLPTATANDELVQSLQYFIKVITNPHLPFPPSPKYIKNSEAIASIIPNFQYKNINKQHPIIQIEIH